MAELNNARAAQASQRHQLREAKKRQRELVKMAKERAKLSILEQARLEVETFENDLDVLLSIHKEQTPAVDWPSLAASLPPPSPARFARNEKRALQHLALAGLREDAELLLEQARQTDEREFQEATKAYADDRAEWEKLHQLARRMLNRDAGAYILAIEELSPFSELANIGSSIHFTVHSDRLLEVVLNTNGRKAIPPEVKTLTASGKVSTKAMPKARFVEIYQDYICGCVLRVARELFALLPVATLLVSATAEAVVASTGQAVDLPILSVVIPRATLDELNFETLDPSDAILAMSHRGDLKASRKSGDFECIAPMTVADVPQAPVAADTPVDAVVDRMRQLRAELARSHAALGEKTLATLSNSGGVS